MKLLSIIVSRQIYLYQIRSCCHCLSTVGWCHHYFTNISENFGRAVKKILLERNITGCGSRIFFQSCFFFFFFLSLSFFLNLAAAPPEGENQVQIRCIVGSERWLTWSFFWGNCHRLEIICCRLCHCFHVLKPRQIIWNWSNRFQAGHAQIVSTSAGSASSAVAKPNSEVFKGFFSCLFPNTDRTGAISRRSITFRRRLSMIRAHTTILKKAIIPWNCHWLCLLQLQWRRAHQDSC